MATSIRENIKAMSTPSQQGMYALQNLEPRTLLDATLAVGEFSLLDNAAANSAGVIMLATGSTAGVTADTVTVNGADDSLTSVTVHIPAAAATYTVRLSTIGTTAAATPNIILDNPGNNRVNLNVYVETINDTNAADGFWVTPAGATSGFTAATYHADSNYSGANPTAALIFGADGTAAPALGNIGTVNFGAGALPGTTSNIINKYATGTIGATSIGALTIGGDLTISADGGNVGLTTIASIDLTTATANLNITSNALGAATTNGGVTVTGTTTLSTNARNLTISTEAANTAASGAQVTLTGAVSLGGANGSGDLTITTSNANVGLGAVTIGNLSTQGTGGGSVTIAPNGTANIGAVSLGTVTIGGNSAGNGVTIGSATTTFASTLTTGAVVNNSFTTAGSNFTVLAAAITGATTFASYAQTNTAGAEINVGNFNLTSGGNVGSVTFTGGIILGDNDGTQDTGTFTIDVTGNAGAISLGGVATSSSGAFLVTDTGTTGAISTGAIVSNSTGNLTISTDSNNTGDATASITTGTIATHNNGNVAITTGTHASSSVTGALTLGATTIGDVNEADTGAVSVTVGGSTGSVTIGNVLLQSTSNAADLNVTISGVAVGAVSIGTVTATGTGIQAGDVNFTVNNAASPTISTLTVGNIALGDVGEAATSDFIFSTTGGTSGLASFGTIANNSDGSVAVTFNSDNANNEAVTGLTVGNISTSKNGSVTFTAGNGAAGGLTNVGALTVGTVTVGRVNQADTGSVNFSVGNNTTSVTIGNVLLQSTNNAADANFTINGTSLGNVGIGTITATGTGVQAGDFNFTATTAAVVTGTLTVGNIALGDVAENATSGVAITLGGVVGATTFGSITNRGDADVAVALDSLGTNSAVASLAIGAVSTSNVGAVTAGNVTFTAGASITGAVSVTSVTLGDTTEADTGDFSITSTGNNGSFGAVTSGAITSLGNGGATVTVDTNGLGAMASVTVTGGITIAGNGANDVNFGHNTGATGLNLVGANWTDATKTLTLAGAFAGYNFVAGDTITLTAGTGVTAGIYTIASKVDADNITLTTDINGAGGNIADNSINGVTSGAARGLGNVTLAALDLTGSGSLNVLAADLGNVVIAGTWNISDAGTVGAGGSVNIKAYDQSANANDATRNGNINALSNAAWDINFAAVANGGVGLINITTADGIAGNILINSVDHAAVADGGIVINANADGATEDGSTANLARVGSIGNFTIAAQGDQTFDSNATNDVAWGNNSSITALSGGNVTIVGAANGTFTANTPNLGADLLATGGTSTWGNFLLTGDATANNVNTSNGSLSNGLTINAGDGVGTITVTGVAARLINANVNANTDTAAELLAANVAGAIGNVTVTGDARFDSLTGTFRGVSMGNFSLDNGNLNIDARTNVTGSISRAGFTTSSIGNIAVTTNGAITGGTLIADENIGNISVNNLTPLGGNIVLATVQSDADGTVAIATAAASTSNYGGTIGTITAPSAITIGTLQSHEVGNFVLRNGTVTTANPAGASQNAGAIVGGSDIAITTIEVGGDLPSISLTESGATAGARTIAITTLDVNGSVDFITTSLGAGDSISITGGRIGGDLNRINAGVANVQITGGLQIVGAKGTPTAIVVTDTGVDYLVDIRGTFATSALATTGATLDLTLTFAAGGPGTNSVTVNNIEGTTSATDTVLSFATRANATGAVVDYTAGLGADTSNLLFNLGGIQDSYDNGVTVDGRHGFKTILVEGNLNGAIGNDVNPNDGTALTLASNAPILGHIVELIVQGNWNNANTIFVQQIEGLAYGSLSLAHGPAAAAGFSYDGPSGQSGINTATNAGNADGLNADLEYYTALVPLTATNLIIPIADGGSITQAFIGPASSFESIRFTDNAGGDGVNDNIVLNATAGLLTNVYGFGQAIGIEYNASNVATPGTNGSTNIIYGIATAGLAATEPTAGNAFDYIESSSTIGSITTTDILTTNATAPSVGNVVVGYVVAEDSTSDLTTAGGLTNYIGDQNDGAGASASALPISAAFAITRGSVGAISVQGSLGGIVASGDVASIATLDTISETPVPTLSANFTGVVADGSVGAIAIDGNVTNSLVVGDASVTSLGTPNVLNNALNVIGINGTPGFTGAINIRGSLGTTPTNVASSTLTRTNSAGVIQGFVQSPSTSYTATFADANETIATGAGRTGRLANLAAGYTGNQVSAPDAIGVDINVGLNLNAAVVSGKRILVDQTEDQSNDDITGNIIAGNVNEGLAAFAGSTNSIGAVVRTTGGNIQADVWSGDDIGLAVGGTVIQALASTSVNAGGYTVYGQGGNITSTGTNTSIDFTATGASPGDITANILAAGDIVDITVTAGSGSGGSLLANIIAGQNPAFLGVGNNGGSIRENLSTNTITADNNVGTPVSGNVVSAAGSIKFTTVSSGNRNDKGLFGVDANNPAFGGSINSDFTAGVAIGSTTPVAANVNDANLPIFQNANAVDGTLHAQTDTITITNLLAGSTVDGSDLDGRFTNDLNSNLNGTFVAEGGITLTTVTIDGNAVGNDGVAGGHVAAAGMGKKDDGNGNAVAASVLTIGTANISGILSGTLSAGMFVGADQAGASPLNPNDLGPISAGTILTPGSVSITTLNVGRWDQTATGTVGSNGITIGELVAGTESGVNTSYAPRFSVAATDTVALGTVTVTGRPFVAPQTAQGNTLNLADGDILGLSIAAFNGVTGSITAADSAQINFIDSNLDAITALNTTQNPSNPSTLPIYNTGAAGNNAVSVTTNGNGTGGLSIEFNLAGFDYFAALGGTAFADSFGLGSISGTLTSNDANPADGEAAASLSFALVGAGQNITGSLVAQGSITTIASALNAAMLPNAVAGNVVAGLDANNAAAPIAAATQFAGGNLSGNILAGGSIGTANTLVGIAAIGSSVSATGTISGLINSGLEAQIGATPATGNLYAFVDAGNNFSGEVETGNADGSAAVIGALTLGIGDSSASFTGGVWAGSGADLDINTTADNSPNAGITGDGIEASGDLNATLGILSENTISLVAAGYGPNGGNITGNIVAEGTISTIAVYGNLGSVATPGLVYTGSVISELIVGNPIGWGSVLNHDASLSTSTFGTVYSSIYEGGSAGSSTPHLHIGGSFAPTANFVGGLEKGLSTFLYEQAGRTTTYTFTAGGVGLFTIQGGAVASPNVIAYLASPTDAAAAAAGLTLTVTGQGATTGLGKFVSLDNLAGLTVVNGSVNQIVVDDEYASLNSDITTALGTLATVPSSFTFLQSSLPSVREITKAVGNSAAFVGITGAVNVDDNIGTTSGANQSIGASLNATLTNAAITVQGSITGSITSNRASIGNIYAGGSVSGPAYAAFDSIGDIYAEQGAFTSGTINAQTGSVGILNVLGNVAAGQITAAKSVGGLVSREGSLSGTLHVANSIGILHSSDALSGTYQAETGNIGLDLRSAGSYKTAHVDPTAAGIQSDLSSVSATFTAGGSVANIMAYTNASSNTITAGTSVGNLTAVTGAVSSNPITAGTSVGNLLANAAVNSNTIIAGTNVGTLTSTTTTVSSNSITVGGSVGNLLANTTIGSNTIAAGAAVGNLTATTGSISSNTVTAGTSVGNLTAYSAISSDSVTAGTNIGNLTASTGNISNDTIIAAGNIGNVIASTGSITASSSTLMLSYNGLNATVNIGTSLSAIAATIAGWNMAGTGTVTLSVENVAGLIRAGGTVGNITAYNNINNYLIQAGVDVGNVTTTIGNIGGGLETLSTTPNDPLFNIARDIQTLIAGTSVPVYGGGSSSNIYQGHLEITGGHSVGNVSAGHGIGGADTTSVYNGITFVQQGPRVNINAVTGSVGNVSSHLGDIGAVNNPLVIKANGGVSIDPDTLLFVAAPVTGRNGIGTIYSETGSLYGDFTTGGDLGTNPDATSAVRGGIAAPLGNVVADLHVGGNLGGISGITTTQTGVVLGSTGLTRNVSDATLTATVDANNPLIVTANGVDYRVDVTGGTATVTYTVAAGVVTVDSVTFNSTDSNTTPATLSISTRTGSGRAAGSGSDSLAAVDVTSLTINGRLRTLHVEGAVAGVTLNGSIDQGGIAVGSMGPVNFVNTGVAANVHTVTLNAGQYVSFPDPVTSGFVTVYLGSGKVQVTVASGFIDEIQILSASASNLVVFNAATRYGSADYTVTSRGANTTTDRLLTTQAAVAAKANPDATKNLLLTRGAVQVNAIDSAIGVRATLTNAAIEGNINEINLAGLNSTISGVTILGSAGRIFADGSITNLNITGNATTVQAGNTLTGVAIGGSADSISASKTLTNVNVRGNAGTVTGGNITKLAVGGSALAIDGDSLNTVSVAGNVGTSTTNGVAATGSAFSASRIAQLLGTSGNPGATSGQLFYGGLFADRVANVSVGKTISDLHITNYSANAAKLFGKTVDDATIDSLLPNRQHFHQLANGVLQAYAV